MNSHRDKVYAILCEVMAIFEETVGTKPLIYGSLGVELTLSRDYQARDIDLILMDCDYEKPSWRYGLLSRGFHQLSRPYLAFIKDGIDVEIANFSYWKKEAGLREDAPQTIDIDGCTFIVMSRSNLIKLYDYLFHHDGRDKLKQSRDAIKLLDLKKANQE